MVESMMALVLVDALMQQEAQCSLFPRGAANGADAADLRINPLGKKLDSPAAL
jgi:hypothetical protein